MSERTLRILVAKLATLGVRGIFRPGATTEEIVKWVRENVRVRTE